MWSDGAWTDRRRWYESEDQYVRRQRALGEQRAEEADARLRRSIRQVTEQKDALARQLADLGAAFDAFVELTAVREELAAHVAGHAARERARTMLAGLLSSAGPDGPRSAPQITQTTQAAQTTSTSQATQTADTAPVDAHADLGYWLPPAAAGLEAVVRGDLRAAEAALASAVGCDEQRTALFLALALPQLAVPEAAVPWLARALGPAPASAGTQVAAAVREVWRLAGRGGYGEPGRSAVADWLAGLDGAEAASRLNELIGRRQGSDSGDDAEARFGRARAAAAALTGLGRAFSAEPPATTARRTSYDEPRDLVETTLAPSLTLLDALIAEGSPAEAEMILRARQLSDEVRRYRAHENVEPTLRWDAPVETPLALLMADLQETSAVDAGLRELAQRTLCRTAASLADQLLAEASAELPTALTLQLDGQRLELLVNEPLDPQMRSLDEAVDRRYAPEPGRAGRKQAAEAVERAAARKARNRSQAQAALERHAHLREQLPELRQTAQQQHTDLLARLGRL